MKTRVANSTLADVMDRHTAAGDPALCRPEGEHVRCLACGHRCLIGDGLRGICKVRFNEGGQLRVPFGYVAGLAMRSGREEAVLSRLSRQRRADLRHAGLRLCIALTAKTG